jgi:hypothetical protein
VHLRRTTVAAAVVVALAATSCSLVDTAESALAVKRAFDDFSARDAATVTISVEGLGLDEFVGAGKDGAVGLLSNTDVIVSYDQAKGRTALRVHSTQDWLAVVHDEHEPSLHARVDLPALAVMDVVDAPTADTLGDYADLLDGRWLRLDDSAAGLVDDVAARFSGTFDGLDPVSVKHAETTSNGDQYDIVLDTSDTTNLDWLVGPDGQETTVSATVRHDGTLRTVRIPIQGTSANLRLRFSDPAPGDLAVPEHATVLADDETFMLAVALTTTFADAGEAIVELLSR